MKNAELQELLQQYPADMDIKFLPDHTPRHIVVMDFTEENILHTSETARVIEAENDEDDDRIYLGSGKQYLLINPIIA